MLVVVVCCLGLFVFVVNCLIECVGCWLWLLGVILGAALRLLLGDVVVLCYDCCCLRLGWVLD